MLEPLIRAAILDGRVYRNMGEEPEHLFRAMGLVLAAAVAFWLGLSNQPELSSESSRAFLAFAALASMMVGWVLWSLVAYVIGTRLLGGTASYRRLLRALGLAYSPGIFLVLIAVPGIGPYLFGVILLWLLAAGTVAVRETQATGWAGALAPAVVGWLPVYLLLANS